MISVNAGRSSFARFTIDLLFVISASVSGGSTVFSVSAFLSSDFPNVVPASITAPFPTDVLPSQSGVSPLSTFSMMALVLSSLSGSKGVELSYRAGLCPYFIFFDSTVLSGYVIPTVMLRSISCRDMAMSTFFSFATV